MIFFQQFPVWAFQPLTGFSVNIVYVWNTFTECFSRGIMTHSKSRTPISSGKYNMGLYPRLFLCSVCKSLGAGSFHRGGLSWMQVLCSTDTYMWMRQDSTWPNRDIVGDTFWNVLLMFPLSVAVTLACVLPWACIGSSITMKHLVHTTPNFFMFSLKLLFLDPSKVLLSFYAFHHIQHSARILPEFFSSWCLKVSDCSSYQQVTLL